jgi:hypothetical protein
VVERATAAFLGAYLGDGEGRPRAVAAAGDVAGVSQVLAQP